jgi:N-hydroxyarylamine O-acetyltransferase
VLDTAAYFKRLNYQGSGLPTLETLRALHSTHMLAVPFENLDISLGRPIRLDEAALYAKIVAGHRGGFCYELNGLFLALLRALGFEVTLLSARVYDHGQLGPEFDHLALRVQLDTPWLADVGFGDSFIEPLRLEAGAEQSDAAGAFRLQHDMDGAWRLQARNAQGSWDDTYAFASQPRQMADFQEMCLYQQTSPDWHFTQHRICSRATPAGRITIIDQRLIVTTHGERIEANLATEAEFNVALRQHFEIDLV